MTILHKRHKNKNVYLDTQFEFAERFDSDTGFYQRSDTIEGKEPFMRSFPNLLDIGIMGSCQHGRSGLCIKAGVQCYQNGLGIVQPNMSVVDYESILKQGKGKLMQAAVGGRGDPNMHPQFEEILKLTREYSIVPNYTTSGLAITKEMVAATKRYCGAVAVSWYRSEYTMDALNAFVKAGCTTNIHYVLGKNSIQEAIARLENNGFPKDIQAVIFLLHKPVGLGQQFNVLTADYPLLQKFFDIVNHWKGPYKIGFDSCSIPGILNFTDNINLQSVDTCEGARFSAYITPDMIMTPCSFDQDLHYGVSLRRHTIQEAWDSEPFNNFRSTLRNSCPGCPKQAMCGGR